jgi:hypothetical protein
MRTVSIVSAGLGAALLLAGVFDSGCAPVDEQSMVGVQAQGSVADFQQYVQPVLQAGCASLDCHGQAGRPLRLYARNGLRQRVELRGLDASESEALANMQAITGLAPETQHLEDHLLLLKPLAVDAGGVHHKGGELWRDQNDHAYRCLHAWLRSGASDDAGRAICGAARP